MTSVGDVIDGRYTVDRELGRGGMSVVWLVHDERLNKMQAIKEINKNANTETHRVLIDQIKVEANIMRNLEHPNIVKVIDYIDDGASIYIVMDYIQGKDLHEVMSEGLRPITEDDVCDWGIQLCDALQYLHDNNIVYRDMKPKNVMLQDDGTVKIIDFGTAKEYKVDKQYDTIPLGSRGFASPEAYISNAPTTPKSDIYSLGVTLFNLATGHNPTEYITLPKTREVNPNVSPALEAIIAKATEELPANRYESCNEMRYYLEEKPEPDIIRRYRRTWRVFLGFAIASIACLAIGTACLGGSALVRDSSYDGILQRAFGASTAEVNGQASEAESLYTEAILLKPSSIEPYSGAMGSNQVSPYNALINNVYSADSAFTPTESSRWDELYRQVEGVIGNSPAYGKLCYDVGTAYFFYYDYGEDGMTKATRAVDWFNYAINDYESRNGQCVLTEQEYNTARAYKTIGDFSRALRQMTERANESAVYAQYWEALEDACASLSTYDNNGNARTGLPDTFPRLKLYETVFQAILGQGYLSGFQRAGISESRITSLLAEIVDRTNDISPVGLGENTERLRNTILDGADEAEQAIQMVFHNASAEGESGSVQSGRSSTNGGSSDGKRAG